MFGRIYYVSTDFQTVSAAQDLLEIVNASTKCLILHGYTIMQSSDTDAELLQLLFKRGIGSTSGSGGGSPTIKKRQTGDSANAFTAERNNTTQAVAGGGSLDTIYTDGFNVLGGGEKFWIPEDRPVFAPSEVLIIAISAPADALTLNLTAVVEEIG